MASNITDALAVELRVRMLRADMSSRAVADVLDVSPMWVTRRLGGQISMSIPDLFRICHALDADPLDVITHAARGAVTA